MSYFIKKGLKVLLLLILFMISISQFVYANDEKLKLFQNITQSELKELEHKLPKHLARGNFYKYAINDDATIDVMVVFYNNVSFEEAKRTVRRYGSIIDNYFYFHRLTVRIPQEGFWSLVREKEVKMVGEKEPQIIILNDDMRKAVGVKSLQIAPYQLTGQGINIGIWDNGLVNHSDFESRVTNRDDSTTGHHATYVGGIMAGSGNLNLTYKGVAIYSDIYSWNYVNVISELQTYAPLDSLSISQNSWGYGYDSSSCGELGRYYLSEIDLDNITINEKVSIIFAAGNERDKTNCNQNINQYGTISRPSTAKNVITVGAVNSDNSVMTNFSSWGPTNDTRIKPDVVAPGCQGIIKASAWYNDPSESIWATYPTNIYYGGCGTSAAAPVVSGTAALMYQQFACLKPHDTEKPLPSTIKALLIHTTKDLNRTGPDYITGWGLINATEAIDYIIYRYFREGNISSSTDVDKYNFTINDSSKPIKVTLVWDDPPGEPEDQDGELVNDLDLYLKAPNGTVYKSWTLDPNNPSAPATQDGNHRDNIEQIVVENPGNANLYTNGIWQIIVNATSCPQCLQKYSLVYKRPWGIRLVERWNLISVPVVLYNSSITNVVGSNTNIKDIWYYNGTGWQGWDSDNSLATLTTMEPRKGYWVNISEPGNEATRIVEVSGDPVTENGASSTSPINLLPWTWNMVGVNSFFNLPINESLNNIDFHGLYLYKGQGQIGNGDSFDVYFKNNTFENAEFDLKAGSGMLIYVYGSSNWTISPSRSCSTAALAEASAVRGASSRDSPFVVYGYAKCDLTLNKTNSNLTIHLKINGTETTNYSMGEVNVNQFRLVVPMGTGGASFNDTAEILINNVPISEGNITIGESGAYYYFNITANETTDSDGDGFSAECLDCNDGNASIFPNATEVCDDVIDNNCNGLIDCGDASCSIYSACMNFSLSASNLTEIYSNLSERLFSFIVTNTGGNIISINWSLDFGDNNVISSNANITLSPNEELFVYSQHNYASQGSYAVTATSHAGGNLSSLNISINVGEIDVSGLSVINTNGTRRTFEFIITNFISTNLSEVAWGFDTGNSFKFNSTSNVTLIPNENLYIFIDYDYGATGNFTVNASAINRSSSDYEVLNVQVN